ncbi:Atlastin-like Protein [Tribolium castaneum]|uniref:Atlastin-like Protein n=2 Tax=Tribolium castaneum TaxID=7070 RepID=A0A139WH35_TRICA|nr:Atlastin-like Protein [Tribolium castaneum]
MATEAVRRAVQIIRNDNNSISLDVNALQNILLRDEIRNKKICVLSITGTFRQGKSFLLNFFLRYLKLKHGSSPLDPNSDWLDPIHGSHLSDFLWDHGSNAHTNGILMWPEIFTIYKPSSNEEIAVVLLDTQGSYDNQTTVENSATIFALSTMISSVQIYNVMRNLNQNDLESVEMFGQYGRLLTNDDCPFQDLWILVRDWLAPYERPFGIPGGESLLQDRLYGQHDALPDEINEQRNNVRNLFQTINCSLLPFPGERVAADHTFNGDLNEINDNFKRYVKQLVERIFEPENLVIKRFNGEEITANDLFQCFGTYTEILGDGLPHVETRLAATINNQHNDAVESSFELYDRQMHHNFSSILLLNNHHESCKTRALDNYHNTRLLGSSLVYDRYEQRLIRKMDERFSIYRERFDFDRDRQLERERRRNQQVSLQQFRPSQSSSLVSRESLSTETIILQSLRIATGLAAIGFGIYEIIRQSSRDTGNSNTNNSSSTRRYSTDDSDST